MSVRAFIAGCAGPELGPDERAFFRAAQPWGLILFRRNCVAPEQVRRLIADFREAVGRDAPVLIDQEGGRVQRLAPPHWRRYPSAEAIGAIHARDPEAGLRAAWLSARLIADDLVGVGVTIDCLPVLDVRAPGSHDVIGDRSYGADPSAVAALGRAAAEGLMAGGVLPVMKHVPGHGRAAVDSHHALPVVAEDLAALAAVDFVPFRALADLPIAMTAHLVYSAIDPDRPATTSATVIGRIIRGEIGFDGLLVSDDLSMNALCGTPAERARAVIEAGCDLVLHCNGRPEEMAAVCEVVPPLEGEAARRAEEALARRGPARALDRTAAEAEFDALVATGVA